MKPQRPTIFFTPFSNEGGDGSLERPFNNLHSAWLAVDNLWNQQRIKYIIYDLQHNTDTEFDKIQQLLKIIRHEIFYDIENMLSSAPKNFNQRIALFAKHFLKSPYVHVTDRYIEWEKDETLVEEAMRLDAFDCLTYVEIVIALAMTQYTTNTKKLLARYCDNLRTIMFLPNTPMSRLTRHRFLDSEWIPSNKKILQEITEKLAPVSYKTAILDKQKLLDYERNRYNYKFEPEPENIINTEPINSKTAYIPSNEFLANHVHILEKITVPHIVTIIRQKENLLQLIGSEYNITHLGFLIPENNDFIFYHATSVDPRAVVALPLTDYVAINNNNILGIGFLKFNY